jgi:hypothetical protein
MRLDAKSSSRVLGLIAEIGEPVSRTTNIEEVGLRRTLKPIQRPDGWRDA